MSAYTFEAIILRSDQVLGMYHIEVPDDITKDFLQDGSTRILLDLYDSKNLHRALVPKGNGIRVITINKELQKRYNLREGINISVTIRKDTSTYGMPVPEELSILFDQDPEGRAFFHKLTRGKQRSLLYIIGKPKTSDTRLHKAIVILDYLKASLGHLDFKELNVAFKESQKR